jgi:hypothetical protein
MKKYQLAKLYRDDSFSGYGIAVDGELLDMLQSTVIITEPDKMPVVTANFILTNDHEEHTVRIDLDALRDK